MMNDRRLPAGFVLGLGLVFLGIVLYARTFFAPPLWDDHYFVQAQSFLDDPRNLFRVLNPRSLIEVLPVRNAARPMWLASVLVDRALLGHEFWVLRVSSALWHALGALLLVALAWELSGDAVVSALAGVLFVAHPAHAETINIVTFRADPIAFVFLALSLLFHLRAVRAGNSRLMHGASLAFFAAALLAKESAAALLLLLPIADALAPAPMRPNAHARRRIYVLFVAVLLAYAYFRIPRSGYVTREGADMFSVWRRRAPELFVPAMRADAPRTPAPAWPQDPPSWSRPLSDPMVRARTMLSVQGDSLRRLFWPYPLQGDYAPKPVRSWRDGAVWEALAFWSALTFIAALACRRAPLLTLGLAWIPASLAPVSGIVTMANLTADRYLYTASAGACLALASLAGLRPGQDAKSRRAAVVLCLALAAVWTTLLLTRSRIFLDDEAYFASTVAVDPDVPRARLNLAVAQWNHGRYEEADHNFAQAVRLWPQGWRARWTYIAFLRSQGRTADVRRFLDGQAL